MHLPSRGLRLSATTIRKTGWFLAPMRFMRIFTDIELLNLLIRGAGPPLPRGLRDDLSKKRGEPRLDSKAWQEAFYDFFLRRISLLFHHAGAGWLRQRAPMIGQTLSQYRILAKLGAGVMGPL